ncbi:MAG: hypothetical protein ACOCQQ_01600 [Candidatus Nanoarchaeia archaeon]
MFIKRLVLQNIRSYESLDVSFSKGITLLQGDIGSGKTTILMAVEFALFGVLRGKTSPAEFLRYGQKNGLVHLECEIQKKNVTIKRLLHKSTSTSSANSTISQSSCSITIDGKSQELTPTELKAKVLFLLGYPESLVGLSTNLFRFTVYTPQEQVKEILLGSVDTRKDIIRKIFGIDKYKKISQNMSYYTSNLRERIQRLKGQTDNVKQLEEQRDVFLKQKNEIKAHLPAIQKDLDLRSAQTKKFEEEVEHLQKQKQERLRLLQQKDFLLTQQKDLIRQITNQSQRISQKEKLVLQEQSKIEEAKTNDGFNSKKKEKLLSAKRKLQEFSFTLSQEFGSLQAQEKSIHSYANKALKLTTCPTCYQEVTSEHKDKLLQEKKSQEKSLSQQRKVLETKKKKLSEKEALIEKKQQEFLNQEKKYLLLEQKKNHVQTMQKEILQLKRDVQTLQDEEKAVKDNLVQVEQKLSEAKVVNDDVAKKKLLEARNKENALKNESFITKQSFVQKQLKQLEQTIEEKKLIDKKITKLTHLRSWIGEFFTPLIGVIEKKVLYSVYKESNNYFASWFSILVEDDSFVVGLDQDFTPLISQNGFDANFDNLSGGEKTSVALAYRLALTKVLNTYFSSLHTKNLLILDEPTTGFSTEQIDNLRDVLSRLNLEQLILVSHEQRLATLADNVVHVSKLDQKSTIG